MERKRLIPLLIAGLLVAAAVGYYLYQKPVERSVSAAAEVSVPAHELLAAFQADEAKAMATYAKADQVIQVSGTVRSIDRSDTAVVNVTIDTGDDMAGVVCEFDQEHAPAWNEGQAVKVNGVCAGYNLDILLQRCAAVE